MNAASGRLLFSASRPSAAQMCRNVTETASALRISWFLYELHLHFPSFSVFDPEITLLGFSLCTVLNIHALVFISSWAAPSWKSSPQEVSYYRFFCCVLGLRNCLFHSVWSHLTLKPEFFLCPTPASFHGRRAFKANKRRLSSTARGDVTQLIFSIRICCCSAVIHKVYIITSYSNNRAELILETQKELKISSVLSILPLTWKQKRLHTDCSLVKISRISNVNQYLELEGVQIVVAAACQHLSHLLGQLKQTDVRLMVLPLKQGESSYLSSPSSYSKPLTRTTR